MNWLCDMMNPAAAGNGPEATASTTGTSLGLSPGNLSLLANSSANISQAAPSTETAAAAGGGGAYDHFDNAAVTSWDLEMVSHWIIIPSLCVMGLLGNSLTFIVLCYRLKEKVDIIEKGSIIGMVALAITDCAFCLVTLYGTFAKDTKMIYTSWSLTLYFKLYGNYVQNVLIKTSTFVTMIMALYRLMAVVYAMNARHLLKPVYPLLSICAGFVFWTLFQVPLIWIWEVQEVQCPRDITYIFLNMGRFEANELLSQSMTYAWAILGFFVPISVLAYCNVKLIMQVRVSTKQITDSHRSRQYKRHNMQLKMTTTLIAIIVCFFLLVFPGEMLHFYQEVASSSDYNLTSLEIAIRISNMLLALNMSFNFILYCIVNTQFRNTLVYLFYTSTCQATKLVKNSRNNMSTRSSIHSEQASTLIKTNQVNSTQV